MQVQRQCDYGDDMVRGLRDGAELNLLETDLPVKIELEKEDVKAKAAEDETYKLLYEK